MTTETQPLTILVTGASRGLGLEFVSQYAAEGGAVIACCREPQKAEALKTLAKTNPSVTIEMLDVTDDKDIAVLSSKLKGKVIDILINCAGVFSGANPRATAQDADPAQSFGSIDSEGWMRTFRTNAVAPVMVAQAFRKNLSLAENGKLIMISSRMGSIQHIKREGDIAYRSSKAALNAAAKSLSFSLKDEKTLIACFHPGWVRTDMGGPTADLSPEQSVSGMRHTIALLTREKSGRFFTYDGQEIPW